MDHELHYHLTHLSCLFLVVAGAIALPMCPEPGTNLALHTKVTRVGIEQIVNNNGVVSKKPWVMIDKSNRCIYTSRLFKVDDRLGYVGWKNTPENRCDQLHRFGWETNWNYLGEYLEGSEKLLR